MGKQRVSHGIIVATILFSVSFFAQCDSHHRLKSLSGQIALEPIAPTNAPPTSNPDNDKVTRSTGGEHVNAEPNDEKTASEAMVKYEEIGLQYTDTAYVSTILATVIPAGTLFLYFTFAGAAPAASGIFAALSSGIMVFYVVLALLINLDTPALIGISVSSPIFAAVFATSMFFPESLGWTTTIFAMNLLAITLISNLTGAVFGDGYGIFQVIPEFANATATIQYTVYFATLLFLASIALAYQCWRSPTQKLPPKISRNFASAFVSSYVVISAISYVAAISGLSLSSPFDPIGFFEIPTLFDYTFLFNYVLLLLWGGLTYSGYTVQEYRGSRRGGEYE